MAAIEEKVNQYKAYLSKYFDNPKEEKILYVFKKLDKLNITLATLQATGIGKLINSFRKHEGQIGEKARQLVGKWKQLVSAQSTPALASSGGGLQTETVSETTYGSHSGRVMHRLDEVVKASYIEGMAVVKKEKEDNSASRVAVKEEPQEDNDRCKSGSSSSHSQKHGSSSKDKVRKREREAMQEVGGDHAEIARKKQKHTVEDAGDGFDLTRVKKEKMRETEQLKMRVKKEPEDGVVVKQERMNSPAPLKDSGPTEDIDNCDKIATSTKDKSSKEGSSGRHSSSHHKSSSSSKHKEDQHHRSRSSEGSKNKHSANISSNTKRSSSEEKVKIKTEPQEKDRRNGSSTKSSNKVKVKSEPVENSDSVMAKSPRVDIGAVKVKLEGDSLSSSSKHFGKTDGYSHSNKHSSGSSNSHHRSANGTTSKSSSNSASDRTSADKASSSSSSKHREKSSSSGSSSKDKDKKHGDKKSKSSSSSSKSGSTSTSTKKKLKKPVMQEFNMFDIPNGVSDSASEGDDDQNGREDSSIQKSALPVKVKIEPGKTISIGRKAKDKMAGSVRLQAKLPAGAVPLPRTQVSLTQDDILGGLPETTPNYKPLPHVDMCSPSKKQELLDNYADFGSKKNYRTLVYSGRRNIFLTSVPTLYDSCISVLKDNIDALDFVGGVPFDIMKPVLEICTSTQLYSIEDTNPQFIGETDELWQEHCKKDFRTQKPEQFESWREMYIRCHDARDAKLKSLTASISKSIQKAKEPVRTTKLAYVDTAVKAPRDVARQQRINGTAGSMGKRDPYSKLSSHQVPGKPIARNPIPRSIDANKSTSLGRARSDHQVKPVAPMMRKTLKFMKSLKR